MTRKWFKLDSPSVVLNAPNMAYPIYHTYHPPVPWNMSAYDIIKLKVNPTAKHLVFNCHGFAWRESFPVPHLSLGTVFHPDNVTAFDPIAKMMSLNVIWLAACSICSSAAGTEFCAEIARHSKSYVVSSMVGQGQIQTPAYCVEDCVESTPVYFNREGKPIGREHFLARATAFGFSH